MNQVYHTNATFNSLRQQVAYCKLQGFDTLSRATSHGPSLFTSGDVWVGVGLSGVEFRGELCGACLQIERGQNMLQGNQDLDVFGPEFQSFPFTAMVFDQCNDPVCTSGFLDFDVYSETPPVSVGNPHSLSWRFVDCPTGSQHKIEYLFCFPGTCKQGDPPRAGAQLRDVWDPYFFGITVRNSRVPVSKATLSGFNLTYVDAFGWAFNGIFPTTDFVITLQGMDGSTTTETIPFETVMRLPCDPSYRGGVLLQGTVQL